MDLGREIGVSVARGLDVLNFLMDVPNFVKNVLRIPKSLGREIGVLVAS